MARTPYSLGYDEYVPLACQRTCDSRFREGYRTNGSDGSEPLFLLSKAPNGRMNRSSSTTGLELTLSLGRPAISTLFRRNVGPKSVGQRPRACRCLPASRQCTTNGPDPCFDSSIPSLVDSRRGRWHIGHPERACISDDPEGNAERTSPTK